MPHVSRFCRGSSLFDNESANSPRNLAMPESIPKKSGDYELSVVQIVSRNCGDEFECVASISLKAKENEILINYH